MPESYEDRELRQPFGAPVEDRDDTRLFTVRKGHTVRYKGQDYTWGTLVQGNHPARLQNRTFFLLAPESLLSGSEAPADSEPSEEPEAQQKPAEGASGPEDGDE